MRYYKHKIYECDCGGVSAPMQTLNNTGGIGNPVPAQMAATTGAEMTDPKCIGSGDKFGFDNKEKKKKKKPIYKRHNKSKVNEGFENVFDSSLVDYSEDFEKADHNYRINKIKEFINEHVLFTRPRSKSYWEPEKFYYIDSEYNVHFNNEAFFIKIYTKDFNKILDPIYELPINIIECNCPLEARHLGLKTLKGFPKIVKGSFDISYNNLKSLEYGPEEVEWLYDAEHNNLKNLVGMPKKINSKKGEQGQVLRLTSNLNLKSSEGLLDNIDYEIEFPKGFYRANKEMNIHPKNWISNEDLNKIKKELRPYYEDLSSNLDHTNILIDYGKIKIVKSDVFDNYYGLLWDTGSRRSYRMSEAGRGKHWTADDLIREFIKRKNKGTF